MNLVLPNGRGANRQVQLSMFSAQLKEIGDKIGMKISSRGWAYQIEQFGLITKNEFDKCESIINECRSEGYLPVDFVAEEVERLFSGVEEPEERSSLDFFADCLDSTLNCGQLFTPDWWIGEKFYIQMLVEKVDLKTLFSPVCKQYHIPIATAKGWSSIIQRATYCRRFKEAEARGLKCVLLYCGDHDPDGLRIGDFLRENIDELKNIQWSDGYEGYNPKDLIIKRFGLDFDFIEENHLTWIDNLITGSGKNLANPSHPNYHLPYMQTYLKTIGERKCEANALIVKPDKARELCRDAIESYLGHDAIYRFDVRKKFVQGDVQVEVDEFLKRKNLKDTFQKVIDEIRGDES